MWAATAEEDPAMSGIGRCSNDIRACHREDQVAHETLDALERRNGGKPLAKSVTPNGAGRTEAKRDWTATEGGKRVGAKAAKALGHHAATETGINVAEHGMKRGLKAFVEHSAPRAAQLGEKALHGLGLVAWIKAGVELGTEAHQGAVADAKAQGQRETDGLHRDAMRAFIVGQSGNVFSAEFRAYLMRDVHSASKRVAGKMVTEAVSARGAAGYDAEKTVVQAMAKQGIAQAKAHGITDEVALAKALKGDASFKEKYEASTAFRLGVASYVYESWRAAQR